MSLELRIVGPSLDLVRTLSAGATLLLGRDAECDVCLPDPERTVSRWHLALRCESGQLHFHVVSVVNGIEMSFGEAPPGARGVLAFGDALKVGDYVVTVASVGPAFSQAPLESAGDAADDSADPWSVFDQQADGSGATIPLSAAHAPDDDVFGEWGFESTAGPGAAGGGGLDASKLGEGNITSFFRGLGMDPVSVGTLTEGEIEAMGRLVRTMVAGVLELHSSATGVKQELRAEDRTRVASKDNNPLKTNWSTEVKLRYLFGGHASAIGFASPERSLRELLVELIAHNGASGAAARAALEATIKEFDPAALKAKLLGEGAKLFESTRAWEAYARHFEKESKDMAKWTQRMLDKYFADAYLRESLRIRRETPPRER
ncbi:type VI secretion system-associated FHA domain protein [Caenimonas koreensis]|uniref:type VI secretion system-associated FHA domain protein n=1 Tax=Caenimonas koreensis TaxID=367474 RepID=UPI003784C56F